MQIHLIHLPVVTTACFLSLTRSKLRLCSVNHRAGYVSKRVRDRKQAHEYFIGIGLILKLDYLFSKLYIFPCLFRMSCSWLKSVQWCRYMVSNVDTGGFIDTRYFVFIFILSNKFTQINVLMKTSDGILYWNMVPYSAILEYTWQNLPFSVCVILMFGDANFP